MWGLRGEKISFPLCLWKEFIGKVLAFWDFPFSSCHSSEITSITEVQHSWQTLYTPAELHSIHNTALNCTFLYLSVMKHLAFMVYFGKQKSLVHGRIPPLFYFPFLKLGRGRTLPLRSNYVHISIRMRAENWQSLENKASISSSYLGCRYSWVSCVVHCLHATHTLLIQSRFCSWSQFPPHTLNHAAYKQNCFSG